MTKRISKGDLIAQVADKNHMSKNMADAVITTFLADILDATKSGAEVQLKGFGTFYRRDRPERMGRNPATGAEILLPPSSTLAFRASRTGDR